MQRLRPSSVHLTIALIALLVSTTSAAQPGRVYVRHIEFVGIAGIREQVLRREMLQLEGAVADLGALTRSRDRLERLPYVASAEIRLREVPDAVDLVDVVVTITQAPARRYGAGGGWSASMGPSVFGYYVDENLLGAGQRLAIEADISEIRRTGTFSHTEPYATPEGVSRTIALGGHYSDRLTHDTSRLRTNHYHLTWQYGWAIGEAQRIRVGVALRSTDLETRSGGARELADWIMGNGRPRIRDDRVATRFTEVDLLVGFHHDTREGAIFPERGTEHAFELRAAAPGSQVEYYMLEHRFAGHRPVLDEWTAILRTRLAFGAAYGGDTTSLPPQLHWFAGGPETVRGFRENRLGPRDSLGNPYGGNLLVSAQLELMRRLPWPQLDRIRVGPFVDAGNVFHTEDVTFRDAFGRPVDHGFDVAELRVAAGVAAHWALPVGTVRLSYGVPLHRRSDADPVRRDEVRRFQVAIGLGF
jgi:outer membrane protein insertion porin family